MVFRKVQKSPRLLLSDRRSWLVTCIILFAAVPSTAQRWDCINIDQISFEACTVLEKFYVETGGLEWLADWGWLRSNQPCSWYGVSCLSTAWPRPIIRIDLSDNNLTGSLPGELSLLVGLRELIIDNSGPGLRKKKLSSNLSATFGALPELEVLILSGHALTGTIPSELGNLSQLRVLKLDGNKFAGPIPDPITNLAALEQLSLARNQLAGRIPPNLGMLSRLRFLDLSNNLLSGPIPQELANLSELQSLDLSDNHFSGSVPQEIAMLTSLRWLSLANNALTGPLPLSLATLGRSLTQCEMSGNNLCVPAAPPYEGLGSASICGLQPISSCSVCDASEDISRAQCRALESLYQATIGQQWEISGDWLASLSACTWHGITCEAFSVTALELPSNGLQGQLPGDLSELTDITRVNLSSNALSGALPESMGNLTQLQELNLSDNSLDGVVPLAVAELGSRIESCNLRDNLALCLPDTPSYRALESDMICGLPLQTACAERMFAEVTLLQAVPGTDGSVMLDWIIQSEAAGIIFHIEQLEGQTYKEVGIVPSSEATSYSFTLDGLPMGLHTFRLRQTDVEGNERWTEEVIVELFGEGLHVTSSYPNPFQRSTTLRFATGTRQQIVVTMFDADGRQVRTLFARTMRAHEQVTLHIGSYGLASGTYFLRFSGDSRVIHTEPLLLLR